MLKQPRDWCVISSTTLDRDYLLVDDFIGQGGTRANFRGYIEAHGASVLGAVSLTGKLYSATRALSDKQLRGLGSKHGELDNWWRERFGFGFNALTESEARYLVRTPDADTIRNRVAAAAQAAQAADGGDSHGQLGQGVAPAA